jgi:hypothetical protein
MPCRSQAGESGESVWAGEGREVVADRGEELGTQQRADAGHAGHDLGELVRPEPGLDELVDFGDFLIEGLDLGRKRWTMRWKAPLNAFQIAFEGRLPPSNN